MKAEWSQEVEQAKMRLRNAPGRLQELSKVAGRDSRNGRLAKHQIQLIYRQIRFDREVVRQSKAK